MVNGAIWFARLILFQDSVEFIICCCIFIDTFYSSGGHILLGFGSDLYIYSVIFWVNVPPIGEVNVAIWLAWLVLFQDSVEFIIWCCIFIDTFFSSGGHIVWGTGSDLYYIVPYYEFRRSGKSTGHISLLHCFSFRTVHGYNPSSDI